MLHGNKFCTNEDVITETEAYFASKDQAYYKYGIEKLEKRWSDCIALDGNYVDE